MKKYILYTIAIISFLFLIRCEKDENPELLKTVFTNKVPELTTVVLSEITDTSAVSGGVIINAGGVKITSNGVCWSISPNPTINDNKTIDSIAKMSFTSKLTALKPFTTYYLRAYAINSIGVAYGNALTFKTSTILAKITTKDITNITDSSVICGGDISSDGGAEINARGVCWSTSQNPTINNSKTLDSIGIGSFISNPKGLNAITTYYLRAYATNGVGTAYGEVKTFSTITSIPKLTTDSIKSITSTSAISGGYIKSTGGLPITAKGVCWNTSPNPTTSDNKTTDGAGATAFTSNITGLNPGTFYYVRAYATNNLGTAYGNELSYYTQTYKIYDFDGNVYDTIWIGNQIWLKQNLKVTHFNNGTMINNITLNSNWSATSLPAYSDYNNLPANSIIYGKLYNWLSVNTGKLCPTGWHVPSDIEWTILTSYLGGENIAGSKLKEIGLSHWISNNSDATNSSGFTALPGGSRHYDGSFNSISYFGLWWSSTEEGSTKARYRSLSNDASGIGNSSNDKLFGFSVRCIKD